MHTEQIYETVEYIRRHIAAIPKLAIILGSGLSEYADTLPQPQILPYDEIPHFPTSTVPGHKGRFVFSGAELVVMQGRFHYYEGYSLQQVTLPIRVLGALGVRRLIVTNAAGGINPQFAAGDFMLLRDHINLMGDNPLRGPHAEEFGPRFPDMTDAYHREDRAVFKAVAKELDIVLREGVYVGLSGPSFETPAEIRMLRVLGADAVGMSTVPEVIVANQMGMRVSGVSCITNLAAGLSVADGVSQKLSHQEVMDTGERVRQHVIALLDGVVRRFLVAEPAETASQDDFGNPLDPQNPPDSQKQEDARNLLIRTAIEARLRAYAPYSNFLVGAAVLTRSGEIFSGCNVENSSYGATTCAEQVALQQAYAQGEREIEKLIIVTDTSPPTPPCGICRQVIRELAGDTEIILANLSGERRYFLVDELLPHAFHKGFLS